MHRRLQPYAAEAGCTLAYSQENLSLSAWKGLAGVPKAGRKDEPQPSGIELDEELDDPDGSPFPAQCRSRGGRLRPGSATPHCPALASRGALFWAPSSAARSGRSAEPLRAQWEATVRPCGPAEVCRFCVVDHLPLRCSFDILEEFMPLPEPEFRHVLERRSMLNGMPQHTLGRAYASSVPAPSQRDPGGSRGAQLLSRVLERLAFKVPDATASWPSRYTERQRFKFKLSYWQAWHEALGARRLQPYVLEVATLSSAALSASRAYHWQCRDLIETLCRHDAKLRARRICDQFAISQ